jgi:hypothetical protein
MQYYSKTSNDICDRAASGSDFSRSGYTAIKNIMILIIVLLPFMVMSAVNAACRFDPNSGIQQGINITVPLEVANVTVGPDCQWALLSIVKITGMLFITVKPC